MIAAGLLGQQVGDRHRVRHDLAVDLRLAHAARDELGVLRAVVDDEHGVALEVGGGLRVDSVPGTVAGSDVGSSITRPAYRG